MISVLNDSLPGRLPSPKLTFTEKKNEKAHPVRRESWAWRA